jgi:hypothetical protein
MISTLSVVWLIGMFQISKEVPSRVSVPEKSTGNTAGKVTKYRRYRCEIPVDSHGIPFNGIGAGVGNLEIPR